MARRLAAAVLASVLGGVFVCLEPSSWVPGALAQTPSTALLVTGSTTLGPGDTAIRDRLTNTLGYTVTVKAASAAVSSDADGKTVVLISASAPATDVGIKFRDKPTPALVWQSSVFDDMKMTGLTQNADYGTASYFTEVIIAAPVHPMAAGLSGIVSVTNTLNTFSWGLPSSSVHLIATLGIDHLGVNQDKTGIFGYEQATLMVGMLAPARRVGMFMTNDTAAAFTGDGWALFEAALAWAATPNQAPIVDAGPALVTIDRRDGLQLNGQLVQDDDQPDPPGTLTYSWTKVSGPGTVSFSSPDTLTTNATFSSIGTYTVRLTANDSLLPGFDDMTVIVNVAEDRAPVVDAGLPQSITLPAIASLTGSAVDEDGLPNPPGVLTNAWSKVSGIGTVTFGNPNALNTTATFSAKGVYVLKLESNDGAHVSFDEVTITVNGSALLVVGSATLTAGDNALKVRLESLGFTTTAKAGSAAVSWNTVPSARK